MNVPTAVTPNDGGLAQLAAILTATAQQQGQQTAPAPARFSIYDHFNLFRAYVNHEDSLINNRLLWNINIQGFLLATYGVTLQKLAEVQMRNGAFVPGRGDNFAVDALCWSVGILPIFGIVISATSYKGVRAAQMAVQTLNQQWTEILTHHYPGQDHLLPKLIGGGCPSTDKFGLLATRAHNWGFRAPRWFPRVFIVTWVALFVGYLFFLAAFWMRAGH